MIVTLLKVHREPLYLRFCLKNPPPTPDLTYDPDPNPNSKTNVTLLLLLAVNDIYATVCTVCALWALA